MKHQLTEEQRLIQKATREFVQGEFDNDKILELIEKKEFPSKLLKKAAKVDLLGITVLESEGGLSGSMLESIIVSEELCRRDSSAGIAIAMADIAADVVSRFGDKSWSQSFISPILNGDNVSCVILPEIHQKLSNFLYLKKDEHIVLNGEASAVLNVKESNYFVVIADNNSDIKRERIVAIVDKNSTGISVSEQKRKLGLNMISMHNISFKNVQIENQYLLKGRGKENPEIFLLKQIILKLTGIYLGIAQGAFDLALEYAKQREQFRKKIAQFQGIQEKITTMYIKLNYCRSTIYTTAQLFDKKDIDLHDLVATKIAAEEVAEFITDESLQIHGGVGYMIDFPIEHFFRDIRQLKTFLGRKIAQIDQISEKIIGLK